VGKKGKGRGSSSGGGGKEGGRWWEKGGKKTGKTLLCRERFHLQKALKHFARGAKLRASGKRDEKKKQKKEKN